MSLSWAFSKFQNPWLFFLQNLDDPFFGNEVYIVRD